MPKVAALKVLNNMGGPFWLGGLVRKSGNARAAGVVVGAGARSAPLPHTPFGAESSAATTRLVLVSLRLCRSPPREPRRALG